MFNAQIERELLDGELWLFGLQPHFHLLIDEPQEKRDIWNLSTENNLKSRVTKSTSKTPNLFNHS